MNVKDQSWNHFPKENGTKSKYLIYFGSCFALELKIEMPRTLCVEIYNFMNTKPQ